MLWFDLIHWFKVDPEHTPQFKWLFSNMIIMIISLKLFYKGIGGFD